MRKQIFFIFLVFSISAYSQKYSVRHKEISSSISVDSVSRYHIEKSGIYMQKSSYSLAGSALLATAATITGIEASIHDSKTLEYTCISCGVLSTIFAFVAIDMHFKAGRELRLSANEISFRF